MRTERVHEESGIRYRIIEEPRVRYPTKQISRYRTPILAADPQQLFARLSSEDASAAKRVLLEGARGWRRWTTLLRHAGADFSPMVAEELLDELCRWAGLLIKDRWHQGTWMPSRFMVERSVLPWLGIIPREQIIADLTADLSSPHLLSQLEAGPPPGFTWGTFAFVLRAAELLGVLAEHGVQPGARELAGLIDHTKAWTPKRRTLLERIMGKPFEDLVATTDRQIGIRGPIEHGQGSLWASSVASAELSLTRPLTGIVLVENAETFKHLLALAELGWVILNVPGGPPPAEIELISRLHAISHAPIVASFDLDPAGLRIAQLVAHRTEVQLQTDVMNPALLKSSSRKLPLSEWDRSELGRLKGQLGELEMLRNAIETCGFKVEQETVQRTIFETLAEMTSRAGV